MGWLPALIAAPLVGAMLIVALRSARVARWIALLVTLGTLVVTVGEASVIAAGAGPVTYLLEITGLAGVFSLTLDGLSAPLVVLTAFLGTVAVVTSWREDGLVTHMALLLALQAAVTAVFLADDLIVFYVAWEAVLIPMFFLIARWGHENRRHAAMKFFLYTFAGSAFMLVGIILLILHGGSSSMAGALSFISPETQRVIFWLLAAGFLVKIPVWPFHTWLPDAHVEAPTAGSIMLAGVLLKMGGYGLIRVAIPFTPQAFVEAAPVLAGLGLVGIVYGAVMAFAQSDVKRLVAYSSVAHMGFVVLAISTGTAEGLAAAMLGMVSHGVVAGMLFFLVGALYERTHTRQLRSLGGFATSLPRWALAFTFASLASLGLPGLSGFPGEFLAVVEGYRAWGWWILVAALGIVLAGVYNLYAVRQTCHGEVRARWRKVEDLGAREAFVAASLAGVSIALGVWPRLVTDVSVGTLETLVGLLGGGR